MATAAQRLSGIVRRGIVNDQREQIGRAVDVVARLQGGDYPSVAGVVAALGRRQIFVPINLVESLGADPLILRKSTVDLRAFARRPGEILLRADLLRHRLIDIEAASLVRARDVELRQEVDGWVLKSVDVATKRLLRRHSWPSMRDWKTFEPLIGHAQSARLRGLVRPIRRLRPAQVADLLEEASTTEQHEILGFVHEDPDFEADVFEEVEPGLQIQLFGDLSDEEAASVLERMAVDDAVDAITDLPQARRASVIERLSEPRRGEVIELLQFNAQTAGGMMSTAFVALPSETLVVAALASVRQSVDVVGEPSTTLFVTDDAGALTGVLPVVELLRASGDVPLSTIAEGKAVHVHPDADVVELALVMSDYNLGVLPVADAAHHLLGVVTVDDVLEATIPETWRRRGLSEHERAEPAR